MKIINIIQFIILGELIALSSLVQICIFSFIYLNKTFYFFLQLRHVPHIPHILSQVEVQSVLLTEVES